MITVSRVGGHSKLLLLSRTDTLGKQHHRLVKLQLDDDA